MSLHARGPISQNVVINDSQDIAVIYGTRIAGQLLRTLGEPTPPGQWFRITKIEDGTAWIEARFEENFR